MNLRLLAIAFFVFMLNSANICAQEGYYWSENYGNRSVLLSGTVNASVEDLGAVFYNPARLGLIENPAFAISAKAYQWETIRVKNGGSRGLELKQSSFGGAPSLAAGTFRIPFLEGHQFAYSFLTRQRKNADFFTRVEEEGQVVDALPGAEVFNGKLTFSNTYDEDWIGLTWAPPAKRRLSVGLSTFVSTINKSNFTAIEMNALNESNESAYSSSKRRYSFQSWGVLWKMGLAADFEKIQLGLTVTTPRVNIAGKGSTLYEEYLVGIDTTGDGIEDDVYIYNLQEGLEVKYQSPWAVGIGAGWPLKNGVIHLSAEWYSQISAYQIMQMAPFVGQSSGTTLRYTLEDELKDVVNFGVGIEWSFSEKISAYASLASDYSAVPEDASRFSSEANKVRNSQFQADFIQYGGGIAIETKAVEITVGATHRGATEGFESRLAFSDASGTSPEDIVETDLSFNRWRFILGFSFPFADKIVKDMGGKPAE
jgi:hypothetical protein